MLSGKDLGNAIETAIRKKGIKKMDLAQDLGVQQASVTGWVKNGRISKENFNKILDYFSDVVSPEHFGVDNIILKNQFDKLDDDKISFDLLDVTATAGKGYYNEDFPETVQKVIFKLDWAKKNIGSNLRNIHLITAKGDSMEPTIKSGDILFVDSTVQFYNGEGIYVISDENGVKVKRLQSRTGSGGMNIISDNSRYKIEQLNREEWEHVRVCGRVVYYLTGGEF